MFLINLNLSRIFGFLFFLNKGLRPIQIWVPDVRSAAFADEARRQSLDVAMADAQSDDRDFVEAVSTQIDK